jgi:predicted hydrocarbon binding protein
MEQGMGIAESRDELQGLLVVMASLSHGLEQVLGRGAETVTFRAGRTVGLKSGAVQAESDLMVALAKVAEALKAGGIEWPFEAWKPAGAASFIYEKDGKQAVKLVFRNCMVRCALFRYGHEQKQSLCMMNHGFFCGYVQKFTGKRAELDILHAGENACLKELLLTG